MRSVMAPPAAFHMRSLSKISMPCDHRKMRSPKSGRPSHRLRYCISLPFGAHSIIDEHSTTTPFKTHLRTQALPQFVSPRPVVCSSCPFSLHYYLVDLSL